MIRSAVCAVVCGASLVWLAGCVNAERPAPSAAGPAVSYGNASPSATAGEPHNSSDVSFLEQAVPLRRQADTLARLAIAHSPDEALRSLAKEIDTAEQPSVTDALDQLRQWGQPAPAATPNPNPVSGDELRQLAGAGGAEFDRRWRDDIGRTLTRSLAVASTEQADGESPAAKATALQWYTELASEQEQLSTFTPS